MSTAIQPTDRLTFIGLSYRNAYFSGWHNPVAGQNVFVKEHYSRMDLLAKITIKQRWEFLGVLPYLSARTSEGTLSQSEFNGVGDISLMGRYAFVNHFGKKVDARLSAGGGVELPTGRSNISQSDGTIMHIYQPGSGSVNFVAILSGGLKWAKYGAAFTAAYRLNGTNKLGYHRGNGENVMLEIFRDAYINKIRILPKISVSAESSRRNLLNDLPFIGNTSRSFVFAGAGIDVYYRHLMINIAGQLPVFQEITHGQLESKNRLQVSANYIF
jgi:hypothetical protein